VSFRAWLKKRAIDIKLLKEMTCYRLAIFVVVSFLSFPNVRLYISEIHKNGGRIYIIKLSSVFILQRDNKYYKIELYEST